LTACPSFDNPKFDIFDAGGQQCATLSRLSVVLGDFHMSSVHSHIGAKVFTTFLISTLVPLAPNLSMESHLGSRLSYKC